MGEKLEKSFRKQVETRCAGKRLEYHEGFVMGYLGQEYESSWYIKIDRQIGRAVVVAECTYLPYGNQQPAHEMANSATYQAVAAGYRAGLKFLTELSNNDAKPDLDDDGDFSENVLSIF